MTEGRFPGLSRPLLDGANGRPQSRFSFRRHSNSIHSCPDADVPVQHQDKTNILPDHFSRVNASEGPGMVSSGFDIHGNHTPPPPVSLLGSRLVTIPHSSPDGLALPTVKRGLYTDPMRTSSTILRTPQQCPSFFPHGFTNASVSTENMHPQSLSKEIKREHFDLGANALSVRMEARDVSAEGTLQSNTWEIRNASSASLFKLARDTPSLQSSTARYSRAPSEVSFNGAMPDDDISMVMMRGATDLRNAKIELEELRRQVKEMKHQVELAQKEKTEAERRWNELKQSSLKGIESSRESVSNMRTRMSELELESRDAFGTAKNLKLSLSELKDLRRTIAESLQTIEPLLGDHGEYLRVSTTKDVVKELKMQAANTQQVVDLLRDQLTASGSELVQANARIAELEECRRIDGEALRASAARVNDMTSRLSELAICLQQQRDELMDALVSAASSESKLEVLRAQIADVTESLRQKNVQLEAAGSLKELNIELQRQVEVYAIELQGLESTRTELRTQTEAVQDREARIKSLVQTLETQEKNTIELKDRLSNIEMQLSERTVELQRACIELADSKARSHAMADLTNELNNKLLRVENDVQRKVEDIQTLQMDLAETRSRVDGLVSQNESLSSENGALKQKIDRTESMLATKGNEVDQYKDRLHECMAQLRVLQERFEDQSITLRITKESNGDLQERLINAEATYARNLESSTNALNMDLRVFQEQKAHAEALLVDAKAELHRLHENTARRLVDVQAETHKTQESIELKLQTESDRARQADQNLIEAIKTQQTLREEFHVLELRYEKLAREAEHAKQISLEHEKTAKDLKTQIQLLGASKAELEERAERIGDRYITGDLSEEEKAFIGNLTRTAESSYEQELIARGNELRKGEIALKALQARNKLLESTLARHLNSQARAQAQTGNESRSMIDLDEWLSSQLSSSPAQVPQHVTIAKAPDRDAPSTNNDDAATNGRPTPAPRRADLRPLATSPVANVHRYHGPPPGAAGRYTPGLKKTAMPPPVCTMPKTTAADRPLIGTANTSMIPATHQTVGLNKTTFTSLATNGSDDIVDFDDDRRVSPVVSVDKALTPKAGKGKASDTVTKRDFSPLEGSLGKRSREGEASPIDAGAGRSNRRAKVAMRKSVRQNGDGDKRKATETLAAPRAKTRKRR